MLPITADYPRTMFSYFGSELPVRRYESVTDMCPASACEPQAAQGFGRLVEDAAIVYGHRLLPEELRDRLPAIDNSWGAFGAQEDRGTDIVSGGSAATTTRTTTRTTTMGRTALPTTATATQSRPSRAPSRRSSTRRTASGTPSLPTSAARSARRAS